VRSAQEGEPAIPAPHFPVHIQSLPPAEEAASEVEEVAAVSGVAEGAGVAASEVEVVTVSGVVEGVGMAGVLATGFGMAGVATGATRVVALGSHPLHCHPPFPAPFPPPQPLTPPCSGAG
jgi:hypothetical protein